VDETTEPKRAEIRYETDEPVRYETDRPIAWVTMDRPGCGNAQNSQMTYALDAALRRAVDDDAIKVIILGGAGRNFSGGHDIGTPGRDVHKSWPRQALWYEHVNKPGAELLYAREQEVYLGMCRRWRELPKPMIAMVQGACIAGGLALAWVCDLIVAAGDAYFQDPVLRMGIPGIEYFAHAFEMQPRLAREFLFLGEPMGAARAYEIGMVNRVCGSGELREQTRAMALKIAEMPRLALALAKQAVNHVEDLRGKRTAMDAAFHMHHFAHAQQLLLAGDALGGHDARTVVKGAPADSAGRAPSPERLDSKNESST
jgi:enoyl-CoA hydratase